MTIKPNTPGLTRSLEDNVFFTCGSGEGTLFWFHIFAEGEHGEPKKEKVQLCRRRNLFFDERLRKPYTHEKPGCLSYAPSYWNCIREKCAKVEQYRIEVAHREHVAKLPAIERAAAALFPETMLPENIRDSALPLDQLEEAQARQHLWVALTSNGQPVGFAMALIIEEAALLVEVDVHPHHQRRGLGRALVQAVIECAQRARLARVVLTTFSDLPWNAPFYESMGFCRLTTVEVTGNLVHRLDQEQRSRLQGRVAMQLVFPLPNDHPASRPGIET